MRRIIPEQNPGVSLGGAISDVGQGLDAVVRSDAVNYVTKAISQTQSQWTQHLIDRQNSAAPGAPNFTGSLEQDYGRYVDQTVKNAPSPLAAQLLRQHLSSFGTQLFGKAMEFEAGQRQKQTIDTQAQATDAAGNELLNDPSLFGQRLAERRDLINSTNLPPAVKQQLWESTQDNLARYATLGAIQKNPYQAMLELQSDKPTQLYTKVLTPALREQLMQEGDRVLHERVADQERMHELTVQQQQETSDGFLKQGILLAQQGKLSASQVQSWAPNLRPEALKYLMDEVSGRDVQSNLHVYSDLLTRSLHGDDVSDDAQHALFSGQLSKDDYTRLVDASSKGNASWVKRGDEYIRTALQVSQMEPDPAKATTLANARNDWQDWSKENAKATPAQAEKEYMDIVRRYQIVQGDQAQLVLPVPRYLVGSRAAPDIQGTKQATVQALRSGQISRQEFNREAALIQRWQAASQRQTQKATK